MENGLRILPVRIYLRIINRILGGCGVLTFTDKRTQDRTFTFVSVPSGLKCQPGRQYLAGSASAGGVRFLDGGNLRCFSKVRCLSEASSDFWKTVLADFRRLRSQPPTKPQSRTDTVSRASVHPPILPQPPNYPFRQLLHRHLHLPDLLRRNPIFMKSPSTNHSLSKLLRNLLRHPPADNLILMPRKIQNRRSRTHTTIS